MTFELNNLKKQMMESEKQRERESNKWNFPLISFRKPEDKKAENAAAAENSEADEPANE